MLSEAELEAKRELAADKTAETLVDLVAGKDYAEGELVFTCEDEAYVTMVADAYGALITKSEYGIVVLKLQTGTVLEAVTVAADMESNMPAVYPNYITRFVPVEGDDDHSELAALLDLPQRQSWETWIFENLENPDPYIGDPQWVNFQWFHDAINTYEAWGVTTGSRDIVVAVIDSGVTRHSELSDHLSRWDIGYGYDDDTGHGTHVAGIIGASLGNGIGGAGVAPGVSLLSIKAGKNGGFYDSDLATAVRLAVREGADIINMSLGGPFPNSTMRSAVSYAISNGVTIVAAMGNDGTNGMNYPAAYDGVIGVVSTDSTGNRAYYSTYGSWADVCAPGSDILSTVPGGYGFKDGTSMASPVVAGVCALYMSAMGHVSPATMEKVLESSCNKLSGKDLGAGIVDAAKMFDKAVNTPSLIVIDENWEYYHYATNNETVTCDNHIDFLSNVTDDNDTLIYTINGKTPSVKNGQIVNGIQYNGPISLEQYKGTTITVRAAAVTGMGNISKVMTMKLKVVASRKPTGISIIAPNQVVAGKTVKLGVEVYPLESADQQVTWTIIKDTTGRAKISSSGTLSTIGGFTGTVVVKVASAVNSSIYTTHTIDVESVPPVATMALDASKASIYVGENIGLYVSSMKDSKKNDIDPDAIGVQWVSSNKKVAIVDQSGNVYGVSKGTATITCKALDGSGKSAKCTVTVKQPVEYISISSNNTVASGASITLKATAYPTTASNKAVKWELVSAPYGTTISTKGVLKVPSGVATGTNIVVRAVAADGCGGYGETWLTVAPKSTAVNIDYSNQGWVGEMDRVTYNNKGWVSALNLMNTDLFADCGYARSEAQLIAYVIGNPYTAVKWTSSNTKVATVGQDGLVSAVGKGTATITCAAQDGSGKKATVKVTVGIPVSQMSIKSNALQMSSVDPCIAIGKSYKHSVVFGDTFGKPTNTKVKWSYEVFTVDYNMNNKGYYTNYCANNKLVSLSSTGVLKINSNMKTMLWNYCSNNDWDLVVAVTATATDGSGVSDTKYYYVNPPTKKIKFTGNIATDGDFYYLEVFCEQENFASRANRIFFTVSSSNPKVVSTYDVFRQGNYKYYYWVQVVGQGKGNAKVTIKAADGTNLSASYNLKVN